MTVRIGLIGAGGMGRAHLARITNELSGGEIVAVADIDHDAAVRAAEPYGAGVHDDSEALINDPDVDAVVIATFGKVHAPDVIRCIEAGKSCARSPWPRRPRTAPGSWRRSRGPAGGSSRWASCAASTGPTTR